MLSRPGNKSIKTENLMSVHKDKFEQVLKTVVPTAIVVTGPDGIERADFNYNGVLMTLVLVGDYLVNIATMGYLPKANLAPLYRALLVENHVFLGAWFCISDPLNAVRITNNCAMAELNTARLTNMLAFLAGVWYQKGMQITTGFQLTATPPV